MLAIALTILLNCSLGIIIDSVGIKDFKEFFEGFYSPSVHYDSNGCVLKEGSPLTTGHIKPDWENAKSSVEGRGKNRKTVCSVPIAVEREIYTAIEDAGPEAVREMAGRELVITCRENDEGGVWAAAIRYRITAPRTYKDGKFTGLEIDVDPNTFAVLSVLEYKKGRIVLRENGLRGGAHPEKHSATLVGADLQNRYAGEGDIHTIGDEVYRAYEVFGATGGIYGGMIRSRSRRSSTGLDADNIADRESAVKEALKKFRFYPVTTNLAKNR